MKKTLSIFSALIFSTLNLTSCAHTGNPIPAEEKITPGYGTFLFISPDSPTIRNFIDSDGDGKDDRFQLHPGGPSYPQGHFYTGDKK